MGQITGEGHIDARLATARCGAAASPPAEKRLALQIEFVTAPAAVVEFLAKIIMPRPRDVAQNPQNFTLTRERKIHAAGVRLAENVFFSYFKYSFLEIYGRVRQL